MLAHGFGGQLLARLDTDDRNRALLPFRMGHADDRSLCDRVMRHDCILHVDRGDPFATALDHVLDPIGELEIPILVDRTRVAATPMTVFGKAVGGIGHIVVLSSDPRAAHAYFSDAHATVWLRLA